VLQINNFFPLKEFSITAAPVTSSVFSSSSFRISSSSSSYPWSFLAITTIVDDKTTPGSLLSGSAGLKKTLILPS